MAVTKNDLKFIERFRAKRAANDYISPILYKRYNDLMAELGEAPAEAPTTSATSATTAAEKPQPRPEAETPPAVRPDTPLPRSSTGRIPAGMVPEVDKLRPTTPASATGPRGQPVRPEAPGFFSKVGADVERMATMPRGTYDSKWGEAPANEVKAYQASAPQMEPVPYDEWESKPKPTVDKPEVVPEFKVPKFEYKSTSLDLNELMSKLPSVQEELSKDKKYTEYNNQLTDLLAQGKEAIKVMDAERAAARAEAREAREASEWKEFAAIMGQALVKLGAGIYGQRTGVDMATNAKFDPVDWSRNYQQIQDQLRDKLEDVRDAYKSKETIRQQDMAATKDEMQRIEGQTAEQVKTKMAALQIQLQEREAENRRQLEIATTKFNAAVRLGLTKQKQLHERTINTINQRVQLLRDQNKAVQATQKKSLSVPEAYATAATSLTGLLSGKPENSLPYEALKDLKMALSALSDGSAEDLGGKFKRLAEVTARFKKGTTVPAHDKLLKYILNGGEAPR